MKIAAKLMMAMLVLLAIAGCSRNQTAPPAGGPTSTKVAPKSAAPVTKTGETMAAHMVDAQLGEWFVKLTPATAKPGMVHFTIRNVGKAIHSLAIEGQGIKQESPRIEAGKSTTLMVDLKPGKYQVWCPVGHHKAKGMLAEFTVK